MNGLGWLCFSHPLLSVSPPVPRPPNRWLAYILLLLLDLIICLFTLLGLAKQIKWLVIV